MEWRRDHPGGLVISLKNSTLPKIKKNTTMLTRQIFHDIKIFEGERYENLEAHSSCMFYVIDFVFFLR
jgi:hypothetical protein